MSTMRIGLNNLVYAVLTKDDATGVAYGPVKPLADIASLDINPTVNSNSYYANDGVSEIATALGETGLSLEVKSVPLAVRAELLGHSYANGQLEISGSDTPPYVAVGFKSLQSDGTYYYVWAYKGKFKVQAQSFKTKAENIEFSGVKLEATFGNRSYDNKMFREADGSDANFNPAIGTGWFNSPMETPDTDAPTVSCVPANGASGVSTSANIVLTFNEAILTSTLEIGKSFVLQKTDGTQIAGAGAWSVGGTVYTFDPTSNMTSGSYQVIVTKGVTDLSGNGLAAVNVFGFTV